MTRLPARRCAGLFLVEAEGLVLKRVDDVASFFFFGDLGFFQYFYHKSVFGSPYRDSKISLPHDRNNGLWGGQFRA